MGSLHLKENIFGKKKKMWNFTQECVKLNNEDIMSWFCLMQLKWNQNVSMETVKVIFQTNRMFWYLILVNSWICLRNIACHLGLGWTRLEVAAPGWHSLIIKEHSLRFGSGLDQTRGCNHGSTQPEGHRPKPWVDLGLQLQYNCSRTGYHDGIIKLNENYSGIK